MRPEFEARLREAKPGVRRLSLTLGTELDRTTITAGRALTVSAAAPEMTVRMPQSVLTQMLTGYRPLPEALHDTRRRAPAPALNLLAALFPLRWPYVWWPDRF
jgi:hypothetical protein